MTEVLLFHHALGLTPGVVGFAEALRAAGHEVETPDLFDGRTFETVDAGVSYAEEIGFGSIAEMGDPHADRRGPRFVVAGFSLGVLPAQRLAQNHPGVAGVLLYHSAIPLEVFGGSWPEAVPAQLHLGDRDPFANEDQHAIDELVELVGAQLYRYDTDKHLIADSTSSDFEPTLAHQLLSRTLAFLADR